jgi:hypothetical protein
VAGLQNRARRIVVATDVQSFHDCPNCIPDRQAQAPRLAPVGVNSWASYVPNRETAIHSWASYRFEAGKSMVSLDNMEDPRACGASIECPQCHRKIGETLFPNLRDTRTSSSSGKTPTPTSPSCRKPGRSTRSYSNPRYSPLSKLCAFSREENASGGSVESAGYSSLFRDHFGRPLASTAR